MVTQFSVGDGNVWRLSGNLTFTTANNLLVEFTTFVSSNSLPQVLDLNEVEYVDSAGLALLVEFKRQAKQIRFSNIPSKMLNLAALSGVQGSLST